MAEPPGIQPLGASRRIRLLIHAFPGAGKTWIAGTSPGRTLILRPPTDSTDALVPRDDLREWVVHDHTELQEALEYLQASGADWDWVWLDSISAWQDHGLDDIWQGVIDRRPDRAGGPVDKGEYGMNMTRLARWVRHAVGVGTFNLGITAWPENIVNPETDEVMWMPWVQGKNMSNRISGYMNVVGYLAVKEHKSGPKEGQRYRVLNTQMTDDYYAKDNFNVLPEHIVNPTMAKIIEPIEAKRAERTPTTRKRPGAKKKRRPANR